MNIDNLTDRFVESLRPSDDRRVEVRDTKVRGLILRLSETGRKTWSVLYRRQSDGRRRRYTVGGYPQFSLADARAEAMGILARVARGGDPAADRRRPAGSRPRTLGDLAERYLARHAKPFKRSGFQDRQMLEKDVLHPLGREPLESIRRSDIAEVVQAIVARGSPIQANRTFEVIRGLYNWALGAGLVETSPCFGLRAPSHEQSRQRVLSLEEIRRFWQALPVAPMSWSTAQILRLCLVSGQRVSEVAGARLSELDFLEREWRLPGSRVKNRSAHIVPLSLFAAELFEEAIERAGATDLIFQSAATKRSITGHAVAKAMSRTLELFDLEDVTPHDLRRTAATGMAKLGVPRLVIDKVLNHVSADRSTIAGIYDRHGYQGEKRHALESWASHLAATLRNAPAVSIVMALPKSAS